MIKDRNIAPDAAISLEKIATATDDGTVFKTISPKATVSAEAATATLDVSDFGKIITNTGATDAIVLTLPAAADVAGKGIKVQLTVAKIVQLKPATGEKIYLGGSWVASKYLDIAWVIGNYADVYSDGTDYIVTAYSWVLTKEA